MRAGLIAAVSLDGVIGIDGQIPWNYPGDWRRFKRRTLGSTVIMGRKTFESMECAPLLGRRNLVVTGGPGWPNVECFPDLKTAIFAARGPIWFIGGAPIYAEGMRYADLIDLTIIPVQFERPGAVKFPTIDPQFWTAEPDQIHEDDPSLRIRLYRRSAPAIHPQ